MSLREKRGVQICGLDILKEKNTTLAKLNFLYMIIIDNFIGDTALLNDIANDKTFFSQNGKYFWYDGWWNSPMNTIKKRLIYELWGPSSVHPAVKCEGFEYWTGQFGEGHRSELGPHFDKDEEHWLKTGGSKNGEVITPVMGSVFYPVPMDIEGGYLEIFKSDNDKNPERIQAKFNRLIVFEAGKYPHRVTEVTKGVRSAIAINLWEEAPTGVKSGSMLIEDAVAAKPLTPAKPSKKRK